MKNHLLPLSAFLSAFLLVSCTSESVNPDPVPLPSSSASSISSTPVSSSIRSSIVRSASPQTGTFDPLASAPAGSDLPWTADIDVPFTVQAPNADWSSTFEEACEEAALLMVQHHLDGNLAFTAQTARDELLDLIKWESAKGYGIDTTTDETATIARDRFGLKTKVYKGSDVTIENMKRILAAGYPIIIPAQGQMLGNPYFSGEGPPYHMLVITGYTRFGSFITNDPGTKRGEGYTYDQDVILNAIHDWTGDKETVSSGQKAILVLSK